MSGTIGYEELRAATVRQVAQLTAAAAITAPKSGGQLFLVADGCHGDAAHASSSHAIDVIRQPPGVRTNCVAIRPRAANAVPSRTPRFSYVLNRCATLPKDSVTAPVSTSSNDVSTPASTSARRGPANPATVVSSGASPIALMSRRPG